MDTGDDNQQAIDESVNTETNVDASINESNIGNTGVADTGDDLPDA